MIDFAILNEILRDLAKSCTSILESKEKCFKLLKKFLKSIKSPLSKGYWLHGIGPWLVPRMEDQVDYYRNSLVGYNDDERTAADITQKLFDLVEPIALRDSIDYVGALKCILKKAVNDADGTCILDKLNKVYIPMLQLKKFLNEVSDKEILRTKEKCKEYEDEISRLHEITGTPLVEQLTKLKGSTGSFTLIDSTDKIVTSSLMPILHNTTGEYCHICMVKKTATDKVCPTLSTQPAVCTYRVCKQCMNRLTDPEHAFHFYDKEDGYKPYLCFRCPQCKVGIAVPNDVEEYESFGARKRYEMEEKDDEGNVSKFDYIWNPKKWLFEINRIIDWPNRQIPPHYIEDNEMSDGGALNRDSD